MNLLTRWVAIDELQKDLLVSVRYIRCVSEVLAFHTQRGAEIIQLVAGARPADVANQGDMPQPVCNCEATGRSLHVLEGSAVLICYEPGRNCSLYALCLLDRHDGWLMTALKETPTLRCPTTK